MGYAFYHNFRYTFRYSDKVYVGLTAEKDAGEPFFTGKNKKGYDYYSPYLLIRDMGRLKTLALGNYRLNYGYGLVMNTDFNMGKTTMNYDGVDIVIYDKERLLVELVRNKRKFSFDYYKELIASYRRVVHELDMALIAEYACELPKSNTVMETLRLEVL